jgi:hypothetical protein
MKLTGIGLYSNENEIANFDFQDPSSDNPYSATDLLGLDDDEIVAKFYGFSTLNRTKLYDFSRKPREIVIPIDLKPRRSISESYSSLRDDLYRAISAFRGGLIDVRFNTGIPWFAYIRGVITKFESNLFTKSPSVQLTIYCEDSMIRGFNTLQFFADSSPTGLNPFIVVDNESTAPHGFNAEFTIHAGLSEFSIVDSLVVGPAPDWIFRVVYPFLDSDILNINSQSGERTVTVTRGGAVHPIVDRIAPASVWPGIFPGTNKLVFSSPGNITMGFLEFTPEFWGV